MASILDELSIRRAVFPVSVDFYHHVADAGLLGEDVELLEGTLVRKMPKSPLHQWVLRLLFRLLERAVGAGRCVLMESPLTLATSEPEPDLAVVAGQESDYSAQHPETVDLVVEIAVSSLEIDRRKAAIYGAAGVREYWIVLPETSAIEVYRQPSAEGYRERRVVTGQGRVESVAVSDFAVELSQLRPPPTGVGR